MVEEVALKRICLWSGPDRILNEVKFLDLLHEHPNVIGLRETCRYQGQITLVLDYFPHVHFKFFYQQMDLRLAQQYMRGLFETLAHLHKHNVMHRDIKPANFLFSGDGRFALVDFGLAEFEGGGEKSAKEKQAGSRHRSAASSTRTTTKTDRASTSTAGGRFSRSRSLRAAATLSAAAVPSSKSNGQPYRGATSGPLSTMSPAATNIVAPEVPASVSAEGKSHNKSRRLAQTTPSKTQSCQSQKTSISASAIDGAKEINGAEARGSDGSSAIRRSRRSIKANSKQEDSVGGLNGIGNEGGMANAEPSGAMVAMTDENLRYSGMPCVHAERLHIARTQRWDICGYCGNYRVRLPEHVKGTTASLSKRKSWHLGTTGACIPWVSDSMRRMRSSVNDCLIFTVRAHNKNTNEKTVESPQAGKEAGSASRAKVGNERVPCARSAPKGPSPDNSD